jgi:hypothetical protein
MTVSIIWPSFLKFQMFSAVTILVSTADLHVLLSKLGRHLSLSREKGIWVVYSEETLQIPFYTIYETDIRPIESCIHWMLELLDMKFELWSWSLTSISCWDWEIWGFIFMCSFTSCWPSQSICFTFAFNWVSRYMES